MKQLGSKLDEQTVVNVTLKASLARAEERTAAAEKVRHLMALGVSLRFACAGAGGGA